MVAKVLFALSLLGLAGCTTTHTLKVPEADYSQRLPEIHVSSMGQIPSWMLRNELRRRGTFEQVREGYSPDGYNVIVLANSDFHGLHNLPLSLLSAFTLFLVPAPVTWDSQVMFHVSHGEQPLARYTVSNHTSAWRGAFNANGGQYEHVRRISDEFIAQMLKDPRFKASPVPAEAVPGTP